MTRNVANSPGAAARRALTAFFFLLLASPCIGQTRVTSDDYARAEKFLNYNVNPLVLHSGVRPVWLPDDRFWYRVTTENGSEFVLVDPARGVRGPVFDQARIAASLSAAAGKTYQAYGLPFTTFTLEDDGRTVAFRVDDKRWTCDVRGEKCSEPSRPAAPPDSVLSPDGKRAAFIREFNLWVRDMATGKDAQLTRDGVEDFGYATDNAGWIRSKRPVVLWSPDSTRIATFQHDGRGVKEMYLVHTAVGHPTLEAWKYPLVGDQKIFQIQRVIVDATTGLVTRLRMPPDEHRSSLCDHVMCDDRFADVEWSRDGRQLAFVSTSRDHKRATLQVADAAGGEVDDLIDERVYTYFEGGDDRPNWRFLPASNEAIWFSERDNWGHLYLYDLKTGRLKNRITSGEGNVSQTIRVDEQRRMVYFLGVGREKGRDPYFVHLYRINLDGQGQTLLTPEDATHDVSMSPSGRYFVDSYSKPDSPPVAVLRDSDGKLIETLEKADVSRLVASGWKPATPITVKARDGATDLYGLCTSPRISTPRRSIRSSIASIPVLRSEALVLGTFPRRAATPRRWPSWASSS